MLAYVENIGGTIRVYNEKSEKISRMQDDFQILGVASDFFVVRDKNYIRTFNEDCKQIAKMQVPDYEDAIVAGQTFTLNMGSKIYTFDEECKVVSKRFS